MFKLSLTYMILLSPPSAWSAQWAKSCMDAAEQSVKHCEAAVAGAKGAESSMVAAGSALSGQQINKNSGIESAATRAQGQNLDSAIKACEQALQRCQKICDTQLKSAQTAATPPTPQNQPAQQDAKQIPQLKSQRCEAPMNVAKAKLGADRAPLDKNASDAKETGKMSGLQMPQGQGGSGGGDDSSPSDPTLPNTGCVISTGTCTGSTGNGLDPASGSAKSGSGQSQFSGSGGDAGAQNASSADGASAVRAGNTSSGGSAIGHSAASGGGGGSLASAAGGAAGASSAGVTDGSEKSTEDSHAIPGGSLSTDGGGGGGGGYDSGNSNGGEEVRTSEFGMGREKPMLPAEPMAGSPHSDSSQPHGPSIFFITDAAIAKFCTQKGVTKNCMKLKD